MDRQPLFILTICFVLGIFFQEQLDLNKYLIYSIIFTCIFLSVSTCIQSYFLYKLKPFSLGLIFFGLGAVFHFFNTFSAKKSTVPSKGTAVFKISKKLNSTEKYKKYESVIKIDKQEINSIIYVPVSNKEFDFNHYYQSEAYITLVKSPQYDFQFDYGKYLKRKNIEYQCYLSDEISFAERNDLSLAEKISQKRLEVLQSIDSVKISGQTREFLKGIILADRTETDSDTVQDFSKSGLMHFLSISGTHIVVIFGLIYFFLTHFLPLKFRKYIVISSLIFIWLFAAFIGFGNSVLRSCIMLSVYFIYVLLQRKPDLLHSLALSIFIILILDTQQLFDVGFQLSFVAILGIFWLNQPILKYLPKQDNYLKKLIFNTISVSLSAQLATLPLVLYYFHQFSFISILANFVIVPFSEIIIVFSFLMTFLIAFNLDLTFINYIYDFIVQILLKSIHWFADFDQFFLKNGPLNLVEVMFIFIILYLLKFIMLKFNYKSFSRMIISVFAFFIIRSGFNIVENQREEILAYDFSENKVFSIKKGDKACFWIENNSDKDKVVKYIINPYSSARRVRNTEIKTFPVSAQKIVYNGKMYRIN